MIDYIYPTRAIVANHRDASAGAMVAIVPQVTRPPAPAVVMDLSGSAARIRLDSWLTGFIEEVDAIAKGGHLRSDFLDDSTRPDLLALDVDAASERSRW